MGGRPVYARRWLPLKDARIRHYFVVATTLSEIVIPSQTQLFLPSEASGRATQDATPALREA